MTLIIPEDQLSSVLDMTPAEILQDGDVLLLTRPGASMRTSLAVLRDFLVSALLGTISDQYAPLDSPAFTNMPTAPTAELTSNDGQIATTEFVQAIRQVLQQAIDNLSAESVGADPEGSAQQALQAHLDANDAHGDRAWAQTAIAQAIASLVNSSPATLDTLAELATALGDDPNFATTISNALGVRLRFDAPQSLTPEQKAQARENMEAEVAGAGASAQAAAKAYTDNALTQVANELANRVRFDAPQTLSAAQKAQVLSTIGAETAGAAAAAQAAAQTYADNAVATAMVTRINPISGSYTLQAADGDGKTYVRQTGGSATLIVPDDSVVIAAGKLVTFGNAGSGTTTIAAVSGSVTLNYAAGALTVGPGERRGLLKVAANTWDVI